MVNKTKKFATISIILIVIGVTIGSIGFGMVGFRVSKLEEPKEKRWYQTIYVNDQGIYSLGVKLGHTN